MTKNMNITLNQNYSQVESFISFLNDIIARMQKHNDFVTSVINDVKTCAQIRQERKAFKKSVLLTLKSFPTFKERDRVNIELHYFRAMNELNILVPKAKREIKDEKIPFFGYFLIRELDKTYSIFQMAQSQMSNQLYKNQPAENLTDPEVYASIVATWGECDDEEY